MSDPAALATHRLERREHKYHIDSSQVRGIRDALRPYCVLDPNRDPVTNSYTIDSLYLDTADHGFFRAYAGEHENRFKLRIRTYPDTRGAPVFVEVKHRANEAIYKLRGKLPADGWTDHLAHPERYPRDEALEHFTALARRYDAQPLVTVRYRREAWISIIDPYARVTFDTRVEACLADELRFPGPADTFRACDSTERFKGTESDTVLEMKFVSNAIPRWMVALVKRFELDRGAFSKYGAAVRAWFGTAALRVPTYGAGL